MSLWILLTVLIAIAAVFASAPFIRNYERKKYLAESNLAVYRDQLKEVDAEAAQGALDTVQAESARTEIKRRILTTEISEGTGLPALSSGERTFAAIAVSGIVVIGSIVLFAMTADLGTPPPPLPPRADSSDFRSFQNALNRPAETQPPSAAASPSASTPTGGRAQSTLPPVDELIQRLVTRLQRNPKDVEGWRMLGWSYFGMERYNEAAIAYSKAIELNPESAEYRDGRMEALIRAANGLVTPEVKSAMEETLKLHPKDPRARYIRGLAQEQAGDRAGAVREWTELLRDIDPADPWAKELAQKIAGTPKTSQPETAARQPAAPETPASAPPTGETRGPTAEDVRAAEALAPSDRSAMIQRMVGGLAERLEKSPRDAEGWIRLARSWTVLGEKEKARQAIESALKVFSDEPEQARRIAALAEELGLSR